MSHLICLHFSSTPLKIWKRVITALMSLCTNYKICGIPAPFYKDLFISLGITFSHFFSGLVIFDKVPGIVNLSFCVLFSYSYKIIKLCFVMQLLRNNLIFSQDFFFFNFIGYFNLGLTLSYYWGISLLIITQPNVQWVISFSWWEHETIPVLCDPWELFYLLLWGRSFPDLR